jgi:hypothetical protein
MEQQHWLIAEWFLVFTGTTDTQWGSLMASVLRFEFPNSLSLREMSPGLLGFPRVYKNLRRWRTMTHWRCCVKRGLWLWRVWGMSRHRNMRIQTWVKLVSPNRSPMLSLLLGLDVLPRQLLLLLHDPTQLAWLHQHLPGIGSPTSHHQWELY